MTRRKIEGSGIRIDFMRVAPEAEENIVKTVRQRLNSQEVAVFKALGHYDLIFVYSRFHERDVFFSGSIDGIRSFSFLDCFYFSDTQALEIISKLSKCRLLASTICAMDPRFLAKTSGVDNVTIKKKIKNSMFNLITLSWGEQVFLCPHDEMLALWKENQEFIQWLHPRTVDIHSIFGINYSLIEDLESQVALGWRWDESIDPSFCLEWQVELKCKFGVRSLEVFNNLVNDIFEKSNCGFSMEGVAHLFSQSSLKCRVFGPDWGSVIKQIRNIRKEATDTINSTKLFVYRNI